MAAPFVPTLGAWVVSDTAVPGADQTNEAHGHQEVSLARDSELQPNALPDLAREPVARRASATSGTGLPDADGGQPETENAASPLPARSTFLQRRHVLAASILALPSVGEARTIQGALPWAPNVATPPPHVAPGPWLFFTEPEAATITAMAHGLIPSDPQGPGADEAGCALFLDRHLAGPHGSAAWLFMQ
ncbi:MAG: hypothetical protein H7276_04445, partial [Caulobacter sp.]|nr:hypothetical protein [Vitreoscilla sp.]